MHSHFKAHKDCENLPVITIKGLNISFGGIRAVNNVSFSILPGEVLGLIGPNGAGKSTVLNCISGVYRPTSGSITVGVVDVVSLPSHSVNSLGVARTFQETLLIDNVSVKENILLGCTKVSRKQQLSGLLRLPRERRSYQDALTDAEALLEAFELSDWGNEDAASVPYGVRKLTEVARAQIGNPRIMLLDEPAAGLGSTETRILTRQIKSLSDKGVAILLIDHNIDFVASVSDRIIVMNSGYTFAEGTPTEIRSDEKVAQAYLGSRRKRDA